MNQGPYLDPQDWDREDAFLPYRERLIYALALASMLILLPFAIRDFQEQRFYSGTAMLAFEFILTVDAWAIHRGKAPPLPLWTLIIPGLGNLAAAMIEPLYIDMAWAYAMVALFYFILPQRTANIVAAVMVASAILLAYFVFASTPYQIRVTTRLGASLGLVAILSNTFIDIISELQRQLRRQTIIDPLTGAYNRRHMDAVLAEAHARVRRGAQAAALLLVDIDHFKGINDIHGHSTGDKVLKDIVTVIQGHVRSSDTLFRYGGEEFALFLPETTLQGAAVVAEQVRRAVADAALLGEHPVTISIGVTTLGPGETPDDCLRHGDAALYRAKNDGRNRVCTRLEPAPAAG